MPSYILNRQRKREENLGTRQNSGADIGLYEVKAEVVQATSENVNDATVNPETLFDVKAGVVESEDF